MARAWRGRTPPTQERCRRAETDHDHLGGIQRPDRSGCHDYNDANQRTRATLVDGSYWDYTYDAQGTQWVLTTTSLAVAYEGNGSVAAFVDVTTGSGTVTYECNPLGNKLVATEAAATDTPHRSNTRCRETVPAYYYYGHRFYSPETGRRLDRLLNA